MSKPSQSLAFLSYLLSLPGALYVLLGRRDDAFAVYHAKQSLALVLSAIVVPLIWAIIAWGLAWIPLAGGMISVVLFALVIAAYIALIYSWIVGLVYAWQGRVKAIPFVGTWAGRLPARAVSVSPIAAESLEPIEGTTIDA